MVQVLGKVALNARTFKKTSHADNDRKDREERAKALGGEFYCSYLVNTGHRDGLEVHTVLTSGVIIVANKAKQVIITWLIAEPYQIKRYGIKDEMILSNARRNKEMGLDY